MDKLERRLREDAARLRADVSPGLDERIRASLEAAAAAPAKPPRPSRPQSSFWWASSLTGLAAALGVIALLNLQPGGDEPPGTGHTVAGPETVVAAPLLHAETAVLTAPLEEELDDLEADLKKAGERVREDLGL